MLTVSVLPVMVNGVSFWEVLWSDGVWFEDKLFVRLCRVILESLAVSGDPLFYSVVEVA